MSETCQIARHQRAQSSNFAGLATRALERAKKISAEGVAIATFCAGCLAVSAYGVVAGVEQQHGINQSLRDMAAHYIPGFASLDINGYMFDLSNGNMHDATVHLKDDSSCDIQFTAVGGWFPDQARVISWGTCPTNQ